MDKKKIKKRISSVIVVMVAIIMFSLNVFAINGSGQDPAKGNYATYEKVVSILGINTEVGSLPKVWPTIYKSAVVFNQKETQAKYVTMWVMADGKKWMSDKTPIKVDGYEHPIEYDDGTTFVKGANVHLWCENTTNNYIFIKLMFYSY